MENSSFATTDKQEKIVKLSESSTETRTVKKFSVPSYEDVLTKIQQQHIDRDALMHEVEQDFAAIQNAENLTTLLQKDKEKAKLMIDSLVFSARQLTSTIATALTSVPVHPYERLIYEYLGPNYKPKDIKDYSIPDSFSPFGCIKELRIIAEANQQLQTTQMAVISAEASNPTFDGTFDGENLNNAFAELVNTPEGKQQFVVNEARLKEYLEFMEMVKAIPIEYIVKNPLEVAKKILSEFIRIHKPTREIIISDEFNIPSIALQDAINDPHQIMKQLYNNYQQLNGTDNVFDLIGFIESMSKPNNVKQSIK